MKKIVYLILVLVSTQLKAQNKQGFFLNDWAPKTFSVSDYQNVEPSGIPPTVTIAVNFKDTIAKVSKYIFGNNVNTYSGQMVDQPNWLGQIRDLNPHILRFPGGNLSNQYFWDRTTSNIPTDIPAKTIEGGSWVAGKNTSSGAMSLDNYYKMLSLTNSTGLICVNYSYARYGTSANPVANAAHYAANWVRYDKGRTKYWEIGNENYGSWEEGYKIVKANNKDGQPETINGGLYGTQFRVFADSMKAAANEIGADIKIGAVTYEVSTSYDPVQTNWDGLMMPQIKDKADFLIIHSYYTNYNENSNAATVMNSATTTKNFANVVWGKMHSAGGDSIPLAMTEWNIFAVGSKQQVSHISGLHADLALGELIKSKFAMATRWDIANGWSNGDDHGMFSQGGEPGVPNHNPRPSFYHMTYFQRTFGDCMVSSSVTGNSDVVAYSSSYSSGESGIVLVNKSTSQQEIKFQLNNFVNGKRYYYYILTGGTDNGEFSRKVYINGQGTIYDGGGPEYYNDIKPYSSKIVDGKIQISAPPRSACFVVIENKKAPEFSEARVDTNTSIVTLKLSSPVTLPSNKAGFTLKLNNNSISISDISISAIDSFVVVLKTNTIINNTDTLTLSYTGNNYKTFDGISLLAFDNKEVDNLLSGSITKIYNLNTDSLGKNILLTFKKEIKPTVSGDNGFKLIVNNADSSAIFVDSVSFLNKNYLLLHLSEPVYSNYSLKLSYSGTQIQSIDNVDLLPFDSALIVNNSPGTPPKIDSSGISNFGYAFDINFNKEMVDPSSLLNQFSITINKIPVNIQSIKYLKSSFEFVPASQILYGDTVILNCKSPLLSKDRGIIDSISDYKIKNNLPVPPPIVNVPDTIQAENYAAMSGIQTEKTTDIGGGKNIGYIDAGDWMEYYINVPEAGTYTIQIRTADLSTNARLTIQLHAMSITRLDSVLIAPTGGWQTWATIYDTLNLKAGKQTIRLTALTSGFNVNWFKFDKGDSIIAPSIISAKTDTTGKKINIVFDKSLYNNTNAALFNVNINNANAVFTVALTTGNNKSITLSLINTIQKGDTVTASYIGNIWKALDNTKVDTFMNYPIENLSTVTTPVNIISLQNGGLIIYPNPASKELNIKSQNDFNYIEIYNVNGQLVLLKQSKIVKNVTTQIKIDLQSGTYFVVLRNSQIKESTKIEVK